MLWRTALVLCAVLGLPGCADPHFIHDPQIGYFDRSQIPLLLKSLRCELATYIAANNQRKIINTWWYPRDAVTADQEFPFFQIDPSKFGGVSLELKIQDSLGTQSGTTADWKRTIDALHTRVWHIAPSLGEQNSYDLLAGFLLPQDIYGLDESDGNPAAKFDKITQRPDLKYLCYKNIPRVPGRIVPTSTYNEIFTEQQLVELARGVSTGEPQFERIRVNAGQPLAAWLLDVGTTMSTTSLTPMPRKENEEIVPGQVTYTFSIQTNIGLDVRSTISTSLWTSLGGEVSGGFQHTGTMTLVLNGLDSITTAGVKSGNTIRVSSRPIKPTTISTLQYCPLPKLGALMQPGFQTGAFCFWPERSAIDRIAANVPRKPAAAKPEARPAEKEIREFLPDSQTGAPKPKPSPRIQQVAPSSRPFLNEPHGTILYPEALTPLGR